MDKYTSSYTDTHQHAHTLAHVSALTHIAEADAISLSLTLQSFTHVRS